MFICVPLKPHLKWSEALGVVLDNGVHCVGHTEPMRPVVIGNAAVVLLDCQCETYETVLIEAAQSKQVHEHVDGVAHLGHVLQVHGAEVVAVGRP